MQNFISLYSKIENPTFEMVLFTFLLAFICSCLIALTYYFTSPSTLRTSNFIQSLILSSVIATMILQSIGDSVASGLGILGALTIINFRTTFRDPRDIIFMFASLGVGIACGSYVFAIAGTGTGLFCFIAFALKFTPFDLGNHFIWELKMRMDSKDKVVVVEKILQTYCTKFNFEGIKNDRSKENPFHEREYVIILKNDNKKGELLEKLEAEDIFISRFSLQIGGMNPE